MVDKTMKVRVTYGKKVPGKVEYSTDMLSITIEKEFLESKSEEEISNMWEKVHKEIDNQVEMLERSKHEPVAAKMPHFFHNIAPEGWDNA